MSLTLRNLILLLFVISVRDPLNSLLTAGGDFHLPKSSLSLSTGSCGRAGPSKFSACHEETGESGWRAKEKADGQGVI